MRKIHTFDIFDTLVARRCQQPSNIFSSVERSLQIPNFAKIRIQAETNVSHTKYSLDDIYAEIVKNFGFSVEYAHIIKLKEIEVEIDNAIPIQENLEKVHDGDVLITDMYLPRYAIEAILEKVGLRKHVGLIISSHGKHSGDIWAKIKNKINIELHSGDNVHSDFDNALTHGIFSEHVTTHQSSQHELFFDQNGLPTLGRVVRESRLKASSNHLNHIQKNQRLLQINGNMPLLILTCIHLHQITHSHGIDNLLFSSRDCYIFEKVFKTLSSLCKWPEQSHYFLTSRIARLKASENYLKYFESLCTSNSMIIDLCGTGWSLGHLYAKSNSAPSTYLVHYVGNNLGIKTNYNQIRNFKSIDNLYYLTDDVSINHTGIELVNYTHAGMFLDMHGLEGYDATIPEFEHPNYPHSVTHAIDEMAVAQDIFMNSLRNHDIFQLVNEIEQKSFKIPFIFMELYKNMCTNLSPLSDIVDYHLRQDKKSMWRLKNN